jgi:hypothetical protein
MDHLLVELDQDRRRIPVTIYTPVKAARLARRTDSRSAYQLNGDGDIEKRCGKCKEWWPADTEFFYPKASTSGGLHDWCKACYIHWKESRK